MKDDEGETIPLPEKAASFHDETISYSISSKSEDSNQTDGSNAFPSSTKNTGTVISNVVKAKQCKGCLYYSSRLKADSRSPVCAGLTRSFPKVPQKVFEQSKRGAYKEGGFLTDFRYACIGHSLYFEKREEDLNGQETQILPICSGFEVLSVRPLNTADSASASASAPIHNREDDNAKPQHRSPKPTNSTGENFLSRFTRNANLVANGVGKNMRRVGNQIKQSLHDALYPYRRPPK